MSVKRKFKKLINDPFKFFFDSKIFSIGKRIFREKYSGGRPLAHGIKVNEWKREYIESRYPEYEWKFYSFKTSARKVFDTIKDPINHRIIVWGYNESPLFSEMAEKNNVKFYRMEDGFIRSVGLGANHELPLSLVLDKTGTLYFDARKASGLENILNEFDFSSNPKIISRAKKAMAALVDKGVSKYNHVASRSALEVYGKYCAYSSSKTRVLVIGQVESDASIKFGSEQPLNNGALVWQARKDHPEADIFFKPHPDTLAGKREIVTPLETIGKFSYVVTDELSLSDSFETIDEVYTITSLSGFEALMRGKKVTTLGCPFYSGWGLTNDLQTNVRRTRTLSLEELFAGAYILYPDYFNSFVPVKAAIEEIVDVLTHEMVDLKKRSLLSQWSADVFVEKNITIDINQVGISQGYEWQYSVVQDGNANIVPCIEGEKIVN